MSLGSEAFGFGSLSQFVSSDFSTQRLPDGNNLLTVFSSDLVVSPKWNSATTMNFILCTDSTYGHSNTSISFANIKYQTDKETELLADLTAAVNTWTNMAGVTNPITANVTLSNGTAATNCLSDPATTANMANRIMFANLGSGGAIAQTNINLYQISGTNLYYKQSDIVFNTNNSVQFTFVTQDCLSAGTPSGNCSQTNGRFSFKGVITHELGHLFGLSHSMVEDATNVANRATMFPGIISTNWKAESAAQESLTLDDKISFWTLYGMTPPSGFEGSISGNVYRAGKLGQRGAHIYVFDADNDKMLTGAFTGLGSGTTAGSNDGGFSIRGLPLNTNFIVVAEAVEQSYSYLDYYRFNDPITLGVEEEDQGYQSFISEAYPDAPVENLRSVPTSALGDATVFRLASGSTSQTGINFYLSQSRAAPNDSAGAGITLSASDGGTISNSTPLKLTLGIESTLEFFSGASLSLTATKAGVTSDWSAAVPAFTYSGTSSEVTVDGSQIKPVDGTYTVVATLTHPTLGTFTATGNFTVSSWGSTGGGGGCNLDPQREFSSSILFVMICFALALIVLQRRLKSDI